jgi:hypothetical protein
MAYTLTKADVLLIAGELSTLGDPTWTVILAGVQLEVSNTDVWGGDAKAKWAATWLAAHLAKLALQSAVAPGGGSMSGDVTGITVGPVSKNFGSLASMIGDKEAISSGLALTRYGVTFRSLQRKFSFTRGVVT